MLCTVMIILEYQRPTLTSILGIQAVEIVNFLQRWANISPALGQRQL